MKNYDETRQLLRELGWSRHDRTENGFHLELWRNPICAPNRGIAYWAACSLSGIENVPNASRTSPNHRRPRVKRLQAKDLRTKTVLDFIDMAGTALAQLRGNNDRQVDTWSIYDRFDYLPPKVVLAKLRKLVRQKKLRGCACGCRGDFELR